MYKVGSKIVHNLNFGDFIFGKLLDSTFVESDRHFPKLLQERNMCLTLYVCVFVYFVYLCVRVFVCSCFRVV